MIYEIIQIKAMLEEVMNNENRCNEGSLDMYYEDIIKKLDNIKYKLFKIAKLYLISESEDKK